jgi:hypothetical protein
MRPLHGLLLALSIVVLVACSELKPSSSSPVSADPVPGPVAFAIPALEFTGLEEGWPPRPKGRLNEKAIDTSGLKDLAAASKVPGPKVGALRATVQKDPGLSNLLGERFEVLRSQSRGPQKLMGPPTGKVTIYSYTMNRAVDVHLQSDAAQAVAGTVAKIVVREEGYQPPESANEIEHAVQLAADKIGGNAKNLEGGAILTPDPQHTNHRVFYVTFRQKDLPRFWALVDLTADKVVANGSFGRS